MEPEDKHVDFCNFFGWVHNRLNWKEISHSQLLCKIWEIQRRQSGHLLLVSVLAGCVNCYIDIQSGALMQFNCIQYLKAFSGPFRPFPKERGIRERYLYSTLHLPSPRIL
jgi:hypothetical protein